MPNSYSLSRLQELLPQLFQPISLPGDLYLRFGLTREVKGLLSMEYVQESLLVPSEQITPIPNMSLWVVGLMSSRNQVFCVIDLAQLVGMPSLSTYLRQYHVVVLRVSQFVEQKISSEQEIFLGIAVEKIEGITRITPKDLRSSCSDEADSLTPYIGGYAQEKEKQLPLFDIKTIVTSALVEVAF